MPLSDRHLYLAEDTSVFQNKFVLLGIGATVLNAATTVNRMMRRIDFKDKVVVITGGSRGLGLVLARRLAKENAKLVLLARNTEELEAAEEQLKNQDAIVRTFECDVTIQKEVEDTLAKIIEEMGAIDILINNAGVIQVGPQEVMTTDDYRNALDSHFWAPLYAALAVVPHMKERKFGRIVNIASIGGKISVPHLLPYNASKFALAGLSEGLRYELMPDNIFVTTVCPGLMRTGSHVNAKFKGKHKLEYALFSTMNSLPFLSANAERAASEIIDACRYGDAELIITMPAKFAAKFKALFPETTAEALGAISRFLPKKGVEQEDGRETKTGKESQSELSPNAFTYLSDKAVLKNNEDLVAAKQASNGAGNGHGNEHQE
jgi:short-subunit dehydrogenase